MRFAWLVARRYLRSPNKPAVLRLVTLLAVVGVAAGVATLVIALAMNTGFRTPFRIVCWASPRTSIFSGPVRRALSDYFALADKLGHTPGVRAVAPAIYLTVLLLLAARRRAWC